MDDYLVKGDSLTAVADAIRAKTGSTETLAFPDGFVDAIEGIGSGSSGSSDVYKTIDYRRDGGYECVIEYGDEMYPFGYYKVSDKPIAEFAPNGCVLVARSVGFWNTGDFDLEVTHNHEHNTEIFAKLYDMDTNPFEDADILVVRADTEFMDTTLTPGIYVRNLLNEGGNELPFERIVLFYHYA